MIVLEVPDGYLCPGLVQQLTDERSGTAATQIGRISEIASPQFLVPEEVFLCGYLLLVKECRKVSALIMKSYL